jgi:hypothetical protein
MPQTSLFPEALTLAAGGIADFMRGVDPIMWWYLLAALLAIRAHRHMWLIYFGLAVLALAHQHG